MNFTNRMWLNINLNIHLSHPLKEYKHQNKLFLINQIMITYLTFLGMFIKTPKNVRVYIYIHTYIYIYTHTHTDIYIYIYRHNDKNAWIIIGIHTSYKTKLEKIKIHFFKFKLKKILQKKMKNTLLHCSIYTQYYSFLSIKQNKTKQISIQNLRLEYCQQLQHPHTIWRRIFKCDTIFICSRNVPCIKLNTILQSKTNIHQVKCEFKILLK